VKPTLHLKSLLSAAGEGTADRLAIFAMVNLGIVESLANGVLSAADAVRLFFHAENCLYVRKHLKEPTADRIMSHGVQLADLFDCLPSEKAQREFLHELSVMRGLCLKLIEDKQLVA
jgi:hypothetical protein